MIKYLAIGGLAYLAYRNAQAGSGSTAQPYSNANPLLARMAVIDPSYDPTVPYSVIALVRHRGQCFIVPLADRPEEVNAAMTMTETEIAALLATVAPGELVDAILFPSCPSKEQAPAALEAWISQTGSDDRRLRGSPRREWRSGRGCARRHRIVSAFDEKEPT
jgi:hypothetical protein